MLTRGRIRIPFPLVAASIAVLAGLTALRCPEQTWLLPLRLLSTVGQEISFASTAREMPARHPAHVTHPVPQVTWADTPDIESLPPAEEAGCGYESLAEEPLPPVAPATADEPVYQPVDDVSVPNFAVYEEPVTDNAAASASVACVSATERVPVRTETPVDENVPFVRQSFDLTDRRNGDAVAHLTIRSESSGAIGSASTSAELAKLPVADTMDITGTPDASVAMLEPRPSASREGAQVHLVGTHFHAPMEIETHNAELSDVLRSIGSQFQKTVRLETTVQGSVTARMSAADGMSLVTALVAPCGYSVHTASDGAIVVSGQFNDELATGPEKGPEVTRLASSEITREPASSTPPHVALASFEARPARQGQQEAAIQQRPPSVSSQAGPIPVHANVGEIVTNAERMLHEGKVNQATDLLCNAVVELPQEGILLQWLARAYLAKSDPASALKAAEQAIAISRQDPAANELLGSILMQIGHDNRGRHYLQQARDLQSGTGR